MSSQWVSRPLGTPPLGQALPSCTLAPAARTCPSGGRGFLWPPAPSHLEQPAPMTEWGWCASSPAPSPLEREMKASSVLTLAVSGPHRIPAAPCSYFQAFSLPSTARPPHMCAGSPPKEGTWSPGPVSGSAFRGEPLKNSRRVEGERAAPLGYRPTFPELRGTKNWHETPFLPGNPLIVW